MILESTFDNVTAIPGVLAVDAVFLSIDVNVKLDNEKLKNIKSLILEQEKFMIKLRNDTINSTFVNYFQPFDPTYRRFPVLILGESSDKASANAI